GSGRRAVVGAKEVASSGCLGGGIPAWSGGRPGRRLVPPSAAPVRSVLQLGCQRLHAGQVATGYLGQAFAVVGVGLVEERQHVMLGFVFGVTEGLAEALDQVFLFLASEGPIQITCLLEVLFLVDLALLLSASQRHLAVAGSFGLRLGRHAAWLVVHL